MSEIRPNDIAEANAFRRTAVSQRAKLAGEGDGHECPSYGELSICVSCSSCLFSNMFEYTKSW